MLYHLLFPPPVDTLLIFPHCQMKTKQNNPGYNFQLNARIAAGNTLLSFLKVFKYLQVSDRFNLLWITLGKATHDLMSFLIIFSLFMLGFGVVGMLIFGPDIENYSTMTATLFTLFQMLLGTEIVSSFLSLITLILFS